MLRAALVVVPVLVGCVLYDSPSPHGDAPAWGTCTRLNDEFLRATADLGTCVTDADCSIVGGTNSCDCSPILGASPSGTAIANNAPGLPHARNVETQFANECAFEAQCGEVMCTCDAAPARHAACSNGRCIATDIPTCFSPPPDAPPDAPFYPDAYVPPDAP